MTVRGLLILGFGGHARSVADVALNFGFDELLFVDENAAEGETLWGFPVLNSLAGPLPQSWKAFPSAGNNALRRLQFEQITTIRWPLATIVAFLRGKGLSDAQVAGVTGNWRVESDFSPTAYNAGEGAIGIAQWEGSRRTRLQALAASRGTKETDLGTQLAFFWIELTGDKKTYAKLKASTDAVGAATVIQADYERSDPSSLADRQSFAQKIAGQLASGGSGGLEGITDGLGADTSASGGSDGSTGGFSGLSAGSLLPWNWGDAADSIVQSIISFVVKLVFAAAGMGLVLLGVNRAVKATQS